MVNVLLTFSVNKQHKIDSGCNLPRAYVSSYPISISIRPELTKVSEKGLFIIKVKSILGLNFIKLFNLHFLHS